MLQSIFPSVRVSGMAAAVPKQTRKVREYYQEAFGEAAVVQFIKNTGVEEQHVAKAEQTASDLACAAARMLLEKKKIEKKEVGILLFVTQTADYKMPATACVLHNRLGLPKECLAFDINLGCSGWIYGLQTAAALLQSLNTRYALLLVGDTLNRMVSPEDKSEIMLFGDGASATLLEKREGSLIRTACCTDGEGFRTLMVPAGGARNPEGDRNRRLWGDGNVRSDYDLYMNGLDVFSFTISETPRLLREFMEEQRETWEDYDAAILHQANLAILERIAKKCRLPKEKLLVSLDRYGNTSGSSIPLGLCAAYGEQHGEKELRLLACGYGIGLSWGAAAFSVQSEDIYPVIETDVCFEGGGISHE